MPKELAQKYAPQTTEEILAYLVEETGEVLAAVGKAARWGLDSCNPELPPAEQVSNRDWILAELVDLERAIALTRAAISPGAPAAEDTETPEKTES
jgi:NTP pyrophosphatase (non-canonical NTP hydrolase)